MAVLPFPTLYKAFQQFDATMPSQWADLERLAPDDTLRLLPDKVLHAFEAIGMTNSASLLAFWRAPGLGDAEERPVVYIDSEGSPVGVLADSFADFLTLLPYGLEFLYRLLTRLDDLRQAPDLLGIYYQAITADVLQATLTTHHHYYPLQAQYVEWLTTVARLAIAPDPVGLVEGANQRHPNLAKWLS